MKSDIGNELLYALGCLPSVFLVLTFSFRIPSLVVFALLFFVLPGLPYLLSSFFSLFPFLEFALGRVSTEFGQIALYCGDRCIRS